MADVPSNLIPTRITQLPTAPVADENSLMMIVYQGNNYQIRVGDLLGVVSVPTSRQVIAGTGMTGGGQLTDNVTLSIASGGVGTVQLASSGVTAGSYGDTANIPVLTVDATGRVMSASSVPASSTATNIAGGAANQLPYQTGAGATSFVAAPVTTGTFLQWNGSALTWAAAGAGSVTSVALSLPAEFTVSGSPVTSSGTLTATLASQTANKVWASPNGASGTPVFRALVAADVPTLNQNTTGTAASLAGGAASQLPYQSGVGTTAFLANGTAGQVLKSNGAAAPAWGGLDGGTF